MTLADLKKNAALAYPALPLERLISRARRRLLRRVLLVLWLVLGSILVLAWVFPQSGLPILPLLGVWLIILASGLELSIWECFFHASYFRGLGQLKLSTQALGDFETALLVSSLSPTDVTGSFLISQVGKMMMIRLEVSSEALTEFLKYRVGRFALAQCVLPVSPEISLPELVRAILQTDREFGDFLFRQGVAEDDLVAVAEWFTRERLEIKTRERWWSREALGRIPGIGKDWSYGQIYLLEKYSRPLPPASGSLEYRYHRKEMEKIEAVLVREREDNVLLVGDDEERKLEILATLSRLIEEGEALPALERKQVILLDAALFSAANDEKGEFEREFIRVFSQAVRAGNIILVIPEFTALAKSAEALGSDFLALIDPYLSSPDLQVIALCGTDEFHDVWEKKAVIAERFERLMLEEVGQESILRILEDEVVALEGGKPVIFTWRALKAVAEGATRYLPGGVLPDAAIDLLFDLASAQGGRELALITRQVVENLVKTKTGIPVGAIAGEEKEKLTNLESFLSRRIVGQNEAITSLAGAIRRARSGVGNPDRPLGSFLFLGPTGVGKTETCKAIADIYFNDEEAIHRLDMSEYSSLDALDKLIGSFSSGESGVLADMIREHPYGVLLLDEFEKAAPKVHNLFLQILDEGFFSDMAGKRVNVRNHLIIATSNAGSDLIWQAMSSGRDLLQEKAPIIEEIIKQGIFKPELLNRFDGVILFHPLLPEHLKKVAELMLKKLAKRLKEKGIILQSTPDLLDYLAGQGADPKFGARSMNRAIQDKVEQIVANRLVAGTLKTGQELVLSAADLT